MNKQLNFFQVNEFGELNQIHLGYKFPIGFIYDVDFAEKSYRTKYLRGTINITWENNNKWIRLNSPNNITAYPSVNMLYIIDIIFNKVLYD